MKIKILLLGAIFFYIFAIIIEIKAIIRGYNNTADYLSIILETYIIFSMFKVVCKNKKNF